MDEWDELDRPPDPREEEALEELERFFDENKERVWFSRQVEVQFEDTWYHWVTNRAIRRLIEGGTVLSEVRPLRTGGTVHVLWHRRYRYPKRGASALIKLVEEYADPNIGAAIGLHGELMVLEGFAKNEFVLKGRNTNRYGERIWMTTQHDLDFVFERDGQAYGVEVKNTLGYMDRDELVTKVKMCAALGVRPVFAARMLPKSWIKEVIDAGGFALVFKYQLYPISHRDLARRVAQEFGLPIDAPKALQDGTMGRFVRWHARNV